MQQSNWFSCFIHLPSKHTAGKYNCWKKMLSLSRRHSTRNQLLRRTKVQRMRGFRLFTGISSSSSPTPITKRVLLLDATNIVFRSHYAHSNNPLINSKNEDVSITFQVRKEKRGQREDRKQRTDRGQRAFIESVWEGGLSFIMNLCCVAHQRQHHTTPPHARAFAHKCNTQMPKTLSKMN